MKARQLFGGTGGGGGGGDVNAHNLNASAHPNLAQFCPNVQRSTAYAVGDVVYHTDLPGYMYLECAQSGTTDSTAITITEVKEKNKVTDGTVIWEMFDFRTTRLKEGRLFGFHIDSSESDPAVCVTYLEDAVGMTPAKMDYSAGTFSYGSWEDAFFMPRPCMLKSDGTVDYYLDPDNYMLKEDGTASDVANADYDGNAMIEWGQNGKKIWWKVVPDSGDATSASIYISDVQYDEDFVCYNFVGKNNTIGNHFYTPIYNGTLVDGKVRSLSGRTMADMQSLENDMASAQANGDGWNVECWMDRLLIGWLLILMGKSLDTKTVFGCGFADTSYRATGLCNSYGLFYGTSASGSVKVFGMENYWGIRGHRLVGLIQVSSYLKFKLTEGTYDGTSVDSYNVTGDGYYSSASAISGGYITKMTFSKKYGMYPSAFGGSSTTYYCDKVEVTSGTKPATCGLAGGDTGVFAFDMNNDQTITGYSDCLSYKQP